MPLYIRKCAKCHGTLSDEDTIRCPHCETTLIDTGVEVEETYKCPECGAMLSRGDSASKKCGTRFPPRRADFTEA